MNDVHCELNLDQVRAACIVRHVRHLAETRSTNDVAREQAAQLAADETLLVIADRQTAGRGRGRNQWWTGDGSLAFSLLLSPQAFGIATRHHPLLSLASAVALVESLQPQVGVARLGLHWPNDVFAAHHKLAGILVEALSDGRHIVGIGLNVNNSTRDAPPELRSMITSLADLTRMQHDRTEVLLAILRQWQTCLASLASDPVAFCRRANGLCLQHGRMLTIQSGTRQTRGLCRGIGDDGALVLQSSQGEQRFYSGVLIDKGD